jgi:hypothetical protein
MLSEKIPTLKFTADDRCWTTDDGPVHSHFFYQRSDTTQLWHNNTLFLEAPATVSIFNSFCTVTVSPHLVVKSMNLQVIKVCSMSYHNTLEDRKQEQKEM